MQNISRPYIPGIVPVKIPLVQYVPPIFDKFITKKIGHMFLENRNPLPFQKKYFVQDFIFEETQNSGALNDFENPKLFGFNYSNQMIAHLYPEMDKTYVVKLPAGVTKGYFAFRIGRELFNRQLAVSGYYDAHPVTVVFGRLNGNAPVITYSYFFIQNGYNGATEFVIEGEFTSAFSFDYIELIANFPSRYFFPYYEYFKLFSHASPSGLNSPNGCAFAMFGYSTDKATDPGRIIQLKKPS